MKKKGKRKWHILINRGHSQSTGLYKTNVKQNTPDFREKKKKIQFIASGSILQKKNLKGFSLVGDPSPNQGRCKLVH